MTKLQTLDKKKYLRKLFIVEGAAKKGLKMRGNYVLLLAGKKSTYFFSVLFFGYFFVFYWQICNNL